jgi:hypothetical protein
MSDNYICNKCNKLFDRKIDLDRHMSRKTVCYKNLSCTRCDMKFNQKSHLTNHLSRKIPCIDKRSLIIVNLQIEQEKTKQKEFELKTEETKLKQLQITSNTQTAGRDINNTNITNIYNIGNINEYKFCEMTKEEVINCIIEGDTFDTLKNCIKVIFDNNNKPTKYIIIKGGKIFTSELDKLIDFDKSRSYINDILRRHVNNIVQRYAKTPDEILDQNGWSQKDYIHKDKIKTVEKIPPFINNNRSQGKYKKIIVSVVK